jgi:hypothetical protein
MAEITTETAPTAVLVVVRLCQPHRETATTGHSRHLKEIQAAPQLALYEKALEAAAQVQLVALLVEERLVQAVLVRHQA